MQFKVGQIIYALLEAKKVIIPIKIVEEITIKNLESEKTTYKAILPNNKQEKVDLEKFDIVFNTIDEASEHLINNAKSAIDELSIKALDLEEKFFAKKIDNSLTCKNESNKIKIDLGDGQEANINIDNINEISNNKEDINGSIKKESTSA